MNLTTEQLDELEYLSYHMIDIVMMAVILEVDELSLREAIADLESEVHKAFYRGYGKQLLELRQDIVKSAHNGSNPSQEQLLKIMQQFQHDIPK